MVYEARERQSSVTRREDFFGQLRRLSATNADARRRFTLMLPAQNGRLYLRHDSFYPLLATSLLHPANR
jgi:hypothetical protein